MAEQPVDRELQQGFLAGLLGDIPDFVRGILATMFGTTICFVAMLQLGGLQVPFTNWLTSQMNTAAKPALAELEQSVAKLNAIAMRIEALELARSSQQTEISTIKGVNDDQDRRITRIERRLGVQ